jgi:hypothetical protein
MVRENGDWGYDCIAGALAILGHPISDQTVGNVLRRFGIAPAPKRQQQMSWPDFICSHLAVLASIDFFTAEVLTCRRLASYYVLFFLDLETCRVTLVGITRPKNGRCRWLAVLSMTLRCVASGSFCSA